MKPVMDIELHKKENIEYFDIWASQYDGGRISKWFQYTQRLSVGTMTLRRDSCVLDIGCGTGYAVRHLGSMLPEGKACGIDLSPQMIEEAKKNTLGEARNVEFQVANAEEIPYPDNTFDAVLCTNSFHHYPNPLKALRGFRRVLKPGGQFVIFENATDLSWYTWAWDKVLRIIEPGHIRYFASQELGKMLRQAGFGQVELRYLKNEYLKHGKICASIQVWHCVEGKTNK